MRILQVSDTYPPAQGGLERVVEQLAHELAARGHDSAVATLAHDDLPDEEHGGGVTVHRLRGWSHHLARFADGPHLLHPTAPDPPLVRRLQTLVDRWQPDVVHVHGWILASCTRLRLPQGTSMVVSLHDYGLVCARKTLIQRGSPDLSCSGPAVRKCISCMGDADGLVKRTALTLGLREGRRRMNRVDTFLPITTAVAQASALAIPGDVAVVPPFVSDHVVAPVDRPRPDFLPGGDFLLYVGALSAHKGVDLAIEAQRLLAGDVPLVLVGHGDAEPWRQRCSGRDVRIVQDVPYEQILAAQQHAAVALVPSRWAEPFGLTVVEAMAAGTPVVVTDRGALPELAGDAGMVVRDDPARWAETIAGLLADPERREALGRAGRSRAAAFTASAVVPRYLEAYAQAQASGRT